VFFPIARILGMKRGSGVPEDNWGVVEGSVGRTRQPLCDAKWSRLGKHWEAT
jgi:hypothetical protein